MHIVRWCGRRTITLLLLALSWNASAAMAQQADSENSPAPAQTQPEPNGQQIEVPSASDSPKKISLPPPHRFWDKTNVLLFSGVAAFRGLDYASTRNMQARGREEILLPDDVVNNSAGFASLEAASTATSIGISYLMHRTGHHKIERWVSIVHISVTAFGDGRNYALKSKHP